MNIGIIITPERKKEKIIQALKEFKLDYGIINLLDDDWYDNFDGRYNGYLIYPPSFPYEWKNLFFKRLYLVEDIIKNISIPSLEGISMYESKVAMHDYFIVNGLPSVKAHTFYDLQRALNHSKSCHMPVMVKSDGGSGAIGVVKISNRRKLRRVIRKSFYINNDFKKYATLKSLKSKLYPFKVFMDSNRRYVPHEGKRKGSIHIQDYIEVKHEWRIIRLGNSYFGHKKLADENGFHSGSLNKGWGPIPEKILNLIKNISDKTNLKYMCYDLFETNTGELLINELQVIFGTSTEEQLMINDEPGRYIYQNNHWIFEKGDFTQNGCNNLRIKNLLELLV